MYFDESSSTCMIKLYLCPSLIKSLLSTGGIVKISCKNKIKGKMNNSYEKR
jgi:hypothetical protein